MEHEGRLIIVSNRLPFRTTERAGRTVMVPSSGGLVSSVGSYLDARYAADGPEERRPLWVGATDQRARRAGKMATTPEGRRMSFDVCPVVLPDTTRDRHYNGFSNGTVWPLFHYFPSLTRFEEDWYEHYRAANQLFLEALEGVVRPGDRVWIHDYHLMLLPRMLRERFPDVPISFFLHIPFPSFEVFRLLPSAWRTELLEGMLGADLVGMQTHDHAQYFLHSVQQVLGHEVDLRTVRGADMSTVVDAFPVSIDPARFSDTFDDHAVVAEKNMLRKNTAGRRLILSVDRLDYTKGVLQRLEGYERLLGLDPELAGKVSYLLLMVPSRDAITKYRELKERIEATVGRINGRFGTVDWQPVIYQYRSVDHRRLCAMYQAADVALITPLRDGMNLVCKEYVAARKDKRGVLVLSETAGAANELGGALIINPSDRNALADALKQALAMPVEEQTARMVEMRQRLWRYDVLRWADDQMGQLDTAVALRRQLRVKEVNPDVRRSILAQYGKARKRWLLLDHDGTLVPFTKRPADAVPDERLRGVLERLLADPRNAVAVVSGRDREVLGTWYDGLPLHLIAEHGACTRIPHGKWAWLALDLEWKEAVAPVLQQFNDRCPGSLVEEKATALAWHYRGAKPDLGFMRSRELLGVLQGLARSFGFQVIEGNRVIEVRPRGVDKGSAVKQLLRTRAADLVIAIGDDRTDEDLFRMLSPDAISIKVGMKPSYARYNVRGTGDVSALLEQLATPALEAAV